jgi:hypothetical protein
VTSLRQSNVTVYFTALKMVANVYIVETPKDLAGLVRDVSRYQGTLRTEDAYELVLFPSSPLFSLCIVFDCVSGFIFLDCFSVGPIGKRSRNRSTPFFTASRPKIASCNEH